MNLHPDIERIALLGWRCAPATRTKKGMFRGYLDQATADLEQLGRWSHQYPGCCWKVIPAGSGVFGLDVDIPGADHAADGVAVLRDLCALHGPLPPRPHGRSGSGGHLMVFRDDGHPIAAGSAKPAPGLDTCAGRNAFTVSPSRNKRNQPYRWTVAPWEVAPPRAPDWLLALMAPPPPPPKPSRPVVPTTDRAMRAIFQSFGEVAGAPRGARNIALHRRAFFVGGFVGAGAIDRSTAERELIEAGIAAGQSRSEAQSTVRSGLNAGELQPLQWGQA
jgi:hypothetical protein